MILSTSNSKISKIVLLLVFLLLAVEVLVRYFLFDTSKDFSRYSTYEERARVLAHQPGLRIAFVGNSMTEMGIDLSVFRDALRNTGIGQVSAEMFVADGSEVVTWYYMLQHLFWKRGYSPDLIIVLFDDYSFSGAENVELGRLAQFFTSPADWPELLRNDLRDTSSRLEFMVSSVWATYAARERVKERTMKLLCINYKEYLLKLYSVSREKASGKGPLGRGQHNLHSNLARMVARSKNFKTEFCFISFPNLHKYDVEPEVIEIIRSGGDHFIDMTRIPQLRPEAYIDDFHLNEIGRVFFSEYLSQRLLPILSQISAKNQISTRKEIIYSTNKN
jgi:hypothetical protein